jgi:protein required for attachment to host cells
MKPVQSLYLLAAEQDFRLVRAVGADLSEVTERQMADFPDDRVGFGHEAGRGHAHGVSFGNSDRTGQEAEERRRFARHAVQALEAEWAKGTCDRIVLVAGPKMLGHLRDALPKGLAQHVAAELPKDLVQVALHDLSPHFQAVPGV